jgi:hypothetical protein
MTINILTAISALDQAKEKADQGTLEAIKAQRELYKKTFYAYADALKDLNQKKISLQDRLVTHQNAVKEDFPPSIPCEIQSQTSDSLSPLASMPSPLETLTKIEKLDEKNHRLTQGLIDKCSKQRDKYKHSIYLLKNVIETCRSDISKLEEQFAQQTLILSTPENPSDSNSSASSKSTNSNPNTDPTMQIQALSKSIEKAEKIYVSDQYDKDSALQNYIFFLFIQAKNEQQAKNKKEESFSLSKFNKKTLSLEDHRLLVQAAETAIKKMDPHRKSSYELDKLFASKKRNIGSKNTSLSTLRKGNKIRTDTIVEITKLEGYAMKIFSRFFKKLASVKQHKNQEKISYKNFGFTSIAFLAGNLLFAQEIYEECRVSYNEQHKAKTSEPIIGAEKLPNILANIEEKIRQIKEVQRLFFTLLEKCQFR